MCFETWSAFHQKSLPAFSSSVSDYRPNYVSKLKFYYKEIGPVSTETIKSYRIAMLLIAVEWMSYIP